MRFKLLSWAVSLCLVAAGAGGCPPAASESLTPRQLVDPPAPAVLPERDYYADLAAVLKAARRADDCLIVDELLRWQAHRLDRQLGLLKILGPTVTPARFPTAEDRLAYWLNARAAWALKLGALAGCPRELKPGDLGRPFRLDGRTMHLADIDEILRSDPDWRAVATAPGVTMDRAAMPARPFAAADVRRQLAARWEAFAADRDRFVIDVQDRRIPLRPVLWGFRAALLGRYRRAYNVQAPTLRAALLDTLSGPGHRRLQDAVGFPVVEGHTTLTTCFRKWYEERE